MARCIQTGNLPPGELYKINVDVALNSANKSTCIGTFIKDEEGNFMAAKIQPRNDYDEPHRARVIIVKEGMLFA